MRPASAPIPSQLRTAVKLIMPLPAEASARKPMPTTAATGLRFKPRMAVRNILTTVLPNAKRLIPIIAETAMLSPRLTAASRFTATASQSAKWPIRTTVITGPRQSPLVPQMQPVPILGIVNPKSNPGAVTRAINSRVIAVSRLARMFVLPVIDYLLVIQVKYKQMRLRRNAALPVINAVRRYAQTRGMLIIHINQPEQ